MMSKFLKILNLTAKRPLKVLKHNFQLSRGKFLLWLFFTNIFVRNLRMYAANISSIAITLKAWGWFFLFWSRQPLILYYIILYGTFLYWRRVYRSIVKFSYLPQISEYCLYPKVGIHFTGCIVELVNNEVLCLFSYIGYCGLPFKICEARTKEKREKYKVQKGL